jgi:hypothetical protein
MNYKLNINELGVTNELWMNSIHQVIMFNFGKHDTNNVQKINLTRFYYDKLNVNMKKTRLWYKFIHWTNDE